MYVIEEYCYLLVIYQTSDRLISYLILRSKGKVRHGAVKIEPIKGRQ